MDPSTEKALRRIDAAIVAIWAGLSLFARRLLGTFPVATDAQAALPAINELGPGKLIWLPLIFYAGLLPLAILLFHRTYASRDPRQMRLGSAAGALGFVLFAIALSLNVVEATASSVVLSGVIGGLDQGALERFTLLWRIDQVLSIAVLVLLAGWMAAVSRAGLAPGFAAWPRWFGLGSAAAAVVTLAAGIWGVVSQGALAALDGGDALILVHLWIGLASTLLWQQYTARPRAA